MTFQYTTQYDGVDRRFQSGPDTAIEWFDRSEASRLPLCFAIASIIVVGSKRIRTFLAREPVDHYGGVYTVLDAIVAAHIFRSRANKRPHARKYSVVKDCKLVR